MVFHGWNNFTSTTYLPTYLPACLPAHSNSRPVAALTLDQILIHVFFLFTSKQTHTHTSLQSGATEGMERESEREGLGLEVMP